MPRSLEGLPSAEDGLEVESPPWARPILDVTAPGDQVLELGRGMGTLAAALARAGRRTTLLDTGKTELATGARSPFADDTFDCVWSCGLLQTLDTAQIDHVVTEATRVSRGTVVALVPNAKSLPYRLGKLAQEGAGTWSWGREVPLLSLRAAFERAGLERVREWTIDPHHALEFLRDRGVKRAFTDWFDSLSREELADLDQGYLLVAVGECASRPAPPPIRRLAVVPADRLACYIDKGLPDLTTYFNPEGWFDEVYCLSPNELCEQELYGMKVIPTPAAELAERVRELQIDVVRAYCLPMALVACADRVEGVPYVVSVHDPRPERCPGSLPHADRYLPMSACVESFLRQKGAAPEAITRLSERADLDVFSPVTDAARRAAFEARFPGRYRVLHVGRKAETKNLDTVLAALALLGPDYTGIFVGRGDTDRYLRLAERLQVADRCHFIDAVPNAELADFYSFADCMCTPSRCEGFGLVFVEALACGALVLTSDIPPMNEFITDGETGVLIADYENPAAVAAHFVRACTDRAHAQAIRARARQAALPFSRETVERREREVYEGLLGGDGAAGDISRRARSASSARPAPASA